MTGEIMLVDPSGLCCAYKMPYDRTGPWTCTTCGLIHGWPCEPQEGAIPACIAEVCLAEELAAIRSFRPLRERYMWTDYIEAATIDRYVSISYVRHDLFGLNP